MPEAVLPTDRTDRSAVKSRQLGSRSRRPVLTPQLPDRSQELGADLDLGPFKPLARDICLHSLLQRLNGEDLNEKYFFFNYVDSLSNHIIAFSAVPDLTLCKTLNSRATGSL